MLGDIHIFDGPHTVPGDPDPIPAMRLASQLYSHFQQPKNVYVIQMNYGDDAWAQQVFNQYADVTYGNTKTAISEMCPTKSCRGGQSHRNSKWDGILEIGKAPGNWSAEDNARLQNGMIFAHEYYHTIQYFNGRNNTYIAPTWLLEGSANWTEKMVAFPSSYADFVKWRSSDLREQYQNPDKFNSAWVEEFLNSFITKKPADPHQVFDYYYGPYTRYYQYLMGGMVTEILISIKSSDSVMNIYKYLGDGKSFEDAFRSEFGTSWAEALPYISKAIAAQFSQQVKS
jgi:hypothetical protein